MATDSGGYIYMTGHSQDRWPGPSFQAPRHEFTDDDMFVLKLSGAGAYQWHTFYGGGLTVEGNGIAVDSGGHVVHVAGRTTMSWKGDGNVSPLHAYTGDEDCFVLKLADRRTLTVAVAGSGTVSSSPSGISGGGGSHDFDYGTAVTLTCNAAGGYYVASISGAGGTPYTNHYSTVTTRSYTTAPLTSNDTVNVTFELALPMVAYVATNGGNVAPYGTWADAATHIQDAVDAVGWGATVWVSNGVYAAGGAPNGSPAMNNRVCMDKDVTVQSVNGASETLIQGAPDPVTGGLGPDATRCVFMSAGLLSGFTLTNGYTRADNDWNTQQGGGGALLRGGVISNCIVTACVASHFGGGLDLFGGDAWNCLVFGNTSYDGGGLLLEGSQAFNCLLRDNRASHNGGGAFFWQSGALNNCTVAGNTATNQGGGVYCYQGGTNNNCIVYSNTTNGVANNYTLNGGGLFAYSCTTPAPGGVGNLANDPQFADAAAGNYRLLAISPCINKGMNGSWMADAADLDGQSRILADTVDMGAYESPAPEVTITNTVTSVPPSQATVVLGGTANETVVGQMTWTNAVSGASGSFAAQAQWTTPAISLAYGQNPLTVTGTNSAGFAASDSITVTREMTPPGGAMAFDGVNDYVNVGHGASLDVGNTVTLEAWIKPANLANRYSVFSTRRDNLDGSFQLEVGPGNGGANRVAVSGVFTWVAETGDNALQPGQWTHIAYTRTGTGAGTHALYVNGVAQTLISDANYTFTNNASDKTIGSGTLGGYFFPGQMDEVRVWNVARTADEVRDAMHKQLTGSESGLVAYYLCNASAGTLLTDLTANANDGTLVNGTASLFRSAW